MNKNTINDRTKTDIGTGVQMSKYFNHNSHASQDNNNTANNVRFTDIFVELL